ncbi:hypothetical protein GCM10023189_60960 [Nibrella saemangeumensis]|uniref:Response regulatory domain-containing protein n=1 Tax=Nibrella saemangeumensis TaxID=1084526 RepID=A0ABP8NR80_9BACT
MESFFSVLVIGGCPGDQRQLLDEFQAQGVPTRHFWPETYADGVKGLADFLKELSTRPILIMVDIDTASDFYRSVMNALHQHPLTRLVPIITYSKDTSFSWAETALHRTSTPHMFKPESWNQTVRTLVSYWSESMPLTERGL